MKAVVVNKPGCSDVLELKDVPIPKIKKGWSIIKVKGFGINRSEIFTREGKSPSVSFPIILGIEVAGIIYKTTDELSLPVGKKVISIMGEMGREFNGSYAQYVLIPNNQIYTIKTKLNWEDLSAVPETYYTAYGSLKSLNLQNGDNLLIRGGTSGVGVAAINLAKSSSKLINITATTRFMKKRELLIGSGAKKVVLDHNYQLQTKNKYDKILDLIGPKTIFDSFIHLDKKGILSQTGELGNQWNIERFDPIFDIPNDKYLTSFYSGDVDTNLLQGMFDFIDEHSVSVKPNKVFKLNQIKEAHDYLSSKKSFGKVVISFL